MARRLLDRPGLDDAGRIRQAYLTAYGRPPTDREIARAIDYLRRFAAILESQGVGSEARRLAEPGKLSARRSWPPASSSISTNCSRGGSFSP